MGNDSVRYYTRPDRNIYERLKSGQRYIVNQYNTLARTVKKTRAAKKKYEIRIASQAKSDPKGSFTFIKCRRGRQ